MKDSFFKTLFPGFKSRREQAIEYLNQSVSMADLESRQREIERGRFH